MKSLPLAVLVASLSLPQARSAQQPARAQPTPSAGERAVLALEEAWPAAVVKRDVATFRRLLAPGFVYPEDARMQTYRAYDLFRNNRPLVRNYPGTHALNNTPNTNITQTVLPTDNRVIFFIPNRERLVNKNLTQNP
jgi:hypothetical protein